MQLLSFVFASSKCIRIFLPFRSSQLILLYYIWLSLRPVPLSELLRKRLRAFESRVSKTEKETHEPESSKCNEKQLTLTHTAGEVRPVRFIHVTLLLISYFTSLEEWLYSQKNTAFMRYTTLQCLWVADFNMNLLVIVSALSSLLESI